VLAGGRGKGHFTSGLQGGVHILKSPEGVHALVDKMIGHALITKQTGEAGRPCHSVYIVEKKDIKRELYLAVLMDRAAMGPVMVASIHGGMDIESVARDSPDDILKMPVDIRVGLARSDAIAFAQKLGFATESESDEVCSL
jgi:succinyl-CoA synthetase beta subunit